MHYCPECGRAYEPAVVICRDCRVGLVDEPPQTGSAYEYVELVALHPVPNVTAGAMLAGALESQGLHPVLRSHALPAHGGVLSDWNTRSWGTLFVPHEELDEARLVLQDFLRTAAERGRLGEDGESDTESDEELS
jgi:hypothetical protein